MKVLTPGELYQNPEIRNRALRWRDFYNEDYRLDEITDPLDEAVQETRLPEYLNSLAKNETTWCPDVKGAALALSCLPYPEIIRNYGEEVLIWALANTDVTQRQEYLYESLSAEGGHDINFLKKAIELNRSWDRVARNNEVQADYDLMRNITDVSLDAIDLPAILSASARSGVKLGEKRIRDYSLFPLKVQPNTSRTIGYAEGWRGKIIDNGYYSIYLDMPVGVGVKYKGIPQAITSFRNWASSELLICQIQGVRGHRLAPRAQEDKQMLSMTGERMSARGLAPLDWRKFLIGICTKIAEMNTKDTIGIYTGGSSNWLSGESARLAYDEPAETMGFERGDDNHWHLPLQSLVVS